MIVVRLFEHTAGTNIRRRPVCGGRGAATSLARQTPGSEICTQRKVSQQKTLAPILGVRLRIERFINASLHASWVPLPFESSSALLHSIALRRRRRQTFTLGRRCAGHSPAPHFRPLLRHHWVRVRNSLKSIRLSAVKALAVRNAFRPPAPSPWPQFPYTTCGVPNGVPYKLPKYGA